MRKKFDIPAIRAKLAGTSGQQYWRSLEELAETAEFQDFLHHEFPQGVDQWLNPIGRRNFVKLMAASLALGGLAACSPQADEKIVPYINAPEEVVPGKSLYFATATQLGGIATGVLAQSQMGRPTKIEGNPDHPGSLGATDLFSQASVLDLYDPDRSQTVSNAGLISAWSTFLSALNLELEKQRLNQGAGLRILTETVTSPTLANQLEALLAEFPQAKWHQYEPINRDNARQGALMAFGQDVNPVYHFDRAEVVLSLEADFMAAGPIGVRYARDFSDKRRVRDNQAEMNRLYVIESTPTITGSMADHRLPVRASQVEHLAWALAAELGLDVSPPANLDLSHVPDNFIAALAQDLQAHAGAGLVLAGRQQPAAVHALAHAINGQLGNAGQTVIYTEPLEANPVNQADSLRALVEEMAAGQVEMLVILEANPVYSAPANLNFGDALRNVNFRVRQGLFEDETSALCQWHIPTKHYLESWSDARAYNGTVTLAQPLIEPLYDDRSPHELLAAMLGQPGLTDYDVLQQYWTEQQGEADFQQFWQQSLHDGLIAGTALPPQSVTPNAGSIEASPAATDSGLEINFRPDPTIWDGRFANNGWLQELPKPITKLTWDNAAMVSPATAERLGVSSEDLVELSYQGRTVQAPVWVLPGQADEAVTLYLGYGRVRVGRVGNGVGFDAYRLRGSESLWWGVGLQLRPLGQQYRLASTQTHYSMEGRHLMRVGTREKFEEEPDFAQHMGHDLGHISLLPGFEYESYAWGMVVDLTACNGCNACVVACQSENNIPIVGKEEVITGREMHWMRIDAYFDGELDNPSLYHQPVMCQHCEQAPCELVCPVNATVHDSEGLNVMVYNRCIGTRYCANNCPYKVRRFNFLHYADDESESLKAQRNPEVTVRTRGIMEKCTYCVQRVSAARITAKKENRSIEDGEVVTACQAACPTQAIIFGDLNDPDSQVSQLKAQPHNYGILTELGTRPRTTYLARVRNPNPNLEEPTLDEEHG